MMTNPQNAKKIDSYIDKYRAIADLNDNEKVRIQGKKVKLDVFRLPLDCLFYNAGNGRFAKEYLKLQRDLKHKLDPLIQKHADLIQKMLLEQNPGKTDWLENNLRDEGQQEEADRRRRVLLSRVLGRTPPRQGERAQGGFARGGAPARGGLPRA